jgi:hypothetical protein
VGEKRKFNDCYNKQIVGEEKARPAATGGLAGGGGNSLQKVSAAGAKSSGHFFPRPEAASSSDAVNVVVGNAHNVAGHESLMVSGNEWYVSEAYRAVNQALGRCIRHGKDFGALILFDNRWTEGNVAKRLSKWLHPFVQYDHTSCSTVARLMRTHFEVLLAARRGDGTGLKPESNNHGDAKDAK